jgi:hypothetical protein
MEASSTAASRWIPRVEPGCFAETFYVGLATVPFCAETRFAGTSMVGPACDRFRS